jgi:hypothetical protein
MREKKLKTSSVIWRDYFTNSLKLKSKRVVFDFPNGVDLIFVLQQNIVRLIGWPRKCKASGVRLQAGPNQGNDSRAVVCEKSGGLYITSWYAQLLS